MFGHWLLHGPTLPQQCFLAVPCLVGPCGVYIRFSGVVSPEIGQLKKNPKLGPLLKRRSHLTLSQSWTQVRALGCHWPQILRPSGVHHLVLFCSSQQTAYASSISSRYRFCVCCICGVRNITKFAYVHISKYLRYLCHFAMDTKQPKLRRLILDSFCAGTIFPYAILRWTHNNQICVVSH